jgi:hypothetical protein
MLTLHVVTDRLSNKVLLKNMPEDPAKRFIKILRKTDQVEMIVGTKINDDTDDPTLAAKIGGGGLGEIIFTGLGLNRTDMLVLGGLLVAALSLLSGVIFDVITRRLLRYKYV